MYLSLNSVLIDGRVPWPEFARLAGRVGYPAVDVDLGRAIEEGLPATKALLEQWKLKPAVVGLPGEARKDETSFRNCLKLVEEGAPFAAALGCPRMVTWLPPSSETPKAELRKILKDRFTAIAAVMARSHVRLGLEFVSPLHARTRWPHEFIWRMNEMAEFASECGSNAGLLLDVWHWHHAGATPADIVAAGRNRIVHVHLSDAPNLPPEKIRDNERLLPGEGVINLTGFFQALKKIGYADAMSIEVFGRLKDTPPEQAAKLGLEAAQAVMRKAGVA